jgi:hypothetical protein
LLLRLAEESQVYRDAWFLNVGWVPTDHNDYQILWSVQSRAIILRSHARIQPSMLLLLFGIVYNTVQNPYAYSHLLDGMLKDCDEHFFLRKFYTTENRDSRDSDDGSHGRIDLLCAKQVTGQTLPSKQEDAILGAVAS